MANMCCNSVCFYAENESERRNLLALKGSVKRYNIEGKNFQDFVEEELGITEFVNEIVTPIAPYDKKLEIVDSKPDRVYFNFATKWNPAEEYYDAVARRIGLHMCYMADELGNDILINTDQTGLYFPERFYVDAYDERLADVLEDSVMSFSTEEELLIWMRKINIYADDFEELQSMLEDRQADINLRKYDYA